jgi:hypothetical protein
MLQDASRRLQQSGLFGLAPGFLDAGLASLAGLVGSLYAARVFAIDQLGLFSLFFIMFQILGLVPARLVLVPAQVVALDLPTPERPAILARSMPLGVLAGLASLPLVWVVVLISPGGDRADYLAFGLTSATMVLLSPLQDHVRFMLHMARRSAAAASVSALQLLLAASALLGLHLAGVPPRWLPFGSLSLANAGSLTFALLLAHPPHLTADRWPGTRAILRAGGLLVPAQLLPLVGTLGAAGLVARLASTEALGAAEAARVIAAPIFVAGLGLVQVLGPQIMDAARRGQTRDLLVASRTFAAVHLVLTGAYLAVVGWSYGFNPAELAIPAAYTVAGLVAFRIVASAATIVAGIPGTALLGVEDNRGLLLASTVAIVVQLAMAILFAAALEAMAVPAAELAGAIALGLVTLLRLRRRVDRRAATAVEA